MATTKHTSVDEGDCPLTSVRPLDPGVAQLIRQEVQAAINGVHESFSAPPSYSSSAPLLSSTIVAEDVDTEAQQPVTPPSMTLSDWGWLVLAMAPMFTWMLSWGVLSSLGVDPLDFAMLAFFLVLFPLSSLIFVCLLLILFSSTVHAFVCVEALVYDALAKICLYLARSHLILPRSRR